MYATAQRNTNPPRWRAAGFSCHEEYKQARQIERATNSRNYQARSRPIDPSRFDSPEAERQQLDTIDWFITTLDHEAGREQQYRPDAGRSIWLFEVGQGVPIRFGGEQWVIKITARYEAANRKRYKIKLPGKRFRRQPAMMLTQQQLRRLWQPGREFGWQHFQLSQRFFEQRYWVDWTLKTLTAALQAKINLWQTLIPSTPLLAEYSVCFPIEEDNDREPMPEPARFDIPERLLLKLVLRKIRKHHEAQRQNEKDRTEAA